MKSYGGMLLVNCAATAAVASIELHVNRTAYVSSLAFVFR